MSCSYTEQIEKWVDTPSIDQISILFSMQICGSPPRLPVFECINMVDQTLSPPPKSLRSLPS